MTGMEVIAVLKSLPGGAKAIGKLIGAPVNALAAWVDVATADGESRANEIRMKSEARSKVILAMGDAAAREISDSPDLAQRSLEYFAGDLVEKQTNREMVALKAISYLSDGEAENPQSDVSPDWLNVFSVFAERASTDRLREHWAAILAGQIRSPGAVSLATLNLMSVIDERLASLISQYARFCFNDGETSHGIPLAGEFASESRYSDLTELDAVGFLAIGSHSITGQEFHLGSFRFRNPGGNKLEVHAAILTPSGIEILNIIQKEHSVSDATIVLEAIKAFDNKSGTIELVLT